MTHGELHALVDTYIQGWRDHRPDTIACYHAAECVAESPMYATLRGRKAIEDAARAFFTSFPDAAQTIEATIVEPPHAAVFTLVQATHVNDFFGLPGTGRRVEFRVGWLMKVDDAGLFEYVRRVYDFTGVLVQLGVQRAKPGRP
jgi:predicted ester cyclase